MPGTLFAADELRDIPVPVDQEMCRDAQPLDVGKPGIGGGVEPV